MLAFSFCLYFFAECFIQVFRLKGFWKELQSLLTIQYRWQILLLSLLRFLVFSSQFVLVLGVFGESINLQTVLAIWQVYLVTMMFPALVLGKLGVKEMISVTILGAIGMNEISVVIASLLIWIMNSLLPALVGFIICKKPKENWT